jgi:hypothetical protein
MVCYNLKSCYKWILFFRVFPGANSGKPVCIWMFIWYEKTGTNSGAAGISPSDFSLIKPGPRSTA